MPFPIFRYPHINNSQSFMSSNIFKCNNINYDLLLNLIKICNNLEIILVFILFVCIFKKINILNLFHMMSMLVIVCKSFAILLLKIVENF